MKTKKQLYGTFGEALAAKFLKSHGYKILETNYVTPFGELDIIAKQKRTFVFVEVKARASCKFGEPSEAVNFSKQRHIIDSAERYLDQHKLFDADYRFDIIEVVGVQGDCTINHIEDAFA